MSQYLRHVSAYNKSSPGRQIPGCW